MRPTAIWNKENLDGVKLLLPPPEVDFAALPPPTGADGGGEGILVAEEPLLSVPLPLEAELEDDDAVEYRALAAPLLEGAGHTVGNCVLHADCVQPADEEAYSEPTAVGVYKFPMQQEQAQLPVLELDPLLEPVDWGIAVQEVDPEDRVCCLLLQGLQPPPLPSVSRPLAL